MSSVLDVNTFKYTDTGAPVLNGVVGSLAALLRSCLVNGYNVQTPSSIVVASGVATVTYATAHGYKVPRVILVAGANTVAANGKKRVLTTTTYTLTFDATGIADGAISGTITTKMAPLGFTEVFTGTNLSAFQGSDATSNSRSILRIDDTAALYARVISYEAMTDINTGTGPMPSTAQLSGGAYIIKSTTSDTTARPWYLIGDGRLFFLYICPAGTTGRRNIFVWGEPISYKSGDAFSTIMSGFNTDATNANIDSSLVNCGTSATSTYTATTIATSVFSYHPWFLSQRGVDALTQSVISHGGSIISILSGANTTRCLSGALGYGAAYPSLVTGGFSLFPVFYKRDALTANGEVRGQLPGVYHSMHDLTSFQETEVSGVQSAPGRVFFICPVTENSYVVIGQVAFDMIGPWR